MTNFYRVSTANMYDSSVRNLGSRQKTLVDLQENLTSGKRVLRASDDPVAAAQAERALTRISRIQSEQRALQAQRDSVAQAESALGDALGLVQELRDLVVAAGNGGLKPEDRKTYANQIQSLREQLSNTVNRKDTNGIPLLGALGSALQPFLGPLTGSPDYQFAGLPGQAGSNGTAIAGTLDGHAALMFDPQRDGVYSASVSASGQRFTTSPVQVKDASQIQPNPTPPGTPYTYSVTVTGVTANPDGSFDATYSVSSTNPNFTATSVTASGVNGAIPIAITDPGGATLSFSINAVTKGADGSPVFAPAVGDAVTLGASPGLMSSIDSAIRGITDAPDSVAASQAVGQALAQIDAGMERLSNMRGYAGELLNRADRITGDQSQRAIQLEADRSRAEDMDMLQGISDFQNANVGYEAALKSYAQVQRLSLFNFISG